MTRQRALGIGKLTAVRRGRGGTAWTLDFRDASGARRRESLGSDRRVAERRHAELIRARDLEIAGLGSVDSQNRFLTDIRTAYLADLRHRSTPAHHENVRARLDRILVELPVKRVRDVKPHHALQLRTNAISAGIGVTTANMRVGTLKAMLNWAVTAGLLASNPIREVRPLREHEANRRHKRRALTDEEIARFLRAADDDDRQWAAHQPVRVPQRPFLQAFLETGARYNELARLTWGDVDLARACITLRAENTKSRRTRVIPLRREMVETLRALPRDARCDRVFRTPDGVAWTHATNNLMRVLNRVLRKAGIARVDQQGRKIDVHGLRHCFASRLARNGVGISVAQKLLGHASPRLTAAVYTHLDVEDLRGAIERIA